MNEHVQDCRIIAETQAAMMIEVGKQQLIVRWIPTSQVKKIVRYPTGNAKVTMTRWIAIKKGLIEP